MSEPSPKPVIIIADDDQTSHILVKGILNSENVDIKSAYSGEEAISLAMSCENVALLLLDIYMDDMDGFEVSLTLRSEERTRHIPIIFQTTKLADDETKIRAYY